ncbi:MAG: hypothetical protein JSV49_02835 [Thermoplasmata archaeon]|nr:MAG: hypothetical protein JSV49_02835 [Thermoplasmata archaeon]
MKYSYSFFRLDNIIIKIHIVYILIFILVPFIFYFIFNLITALAILNFLILLSFSVVIHELGHAYYAQRYKVYIHEIILLPFSGISVRSGMPKDELDEFRIASIGPLVSFSIVLCMAPFIYFFYGFEYLLRLNILEFSPILKFFKINLVLTIFNLIPIYPMDGGRMLRAVLSHKLDYQRATIWVTRLTYIIIIALIVMGLVFNLLVILFAFFLYGAAHSKKNFDLAAELLGAGETKEKRRVVERYRADRRALIDLSEDLSIKAEQILTSTSLVNKPAKILFRFWELYEQKLLIGRSKWFRNFIISILTLFIRVKDIGRFWLRTHPVKKSVVLMLFASLWLTLEWLLPQQFLMPFGLLFILFFAAGAFIIYYHTRSKQLFWFTVIACSSWSLYMVIDMIEPLLDLSYRGYLYLEAFRGCMVPLTGILFFAVLINSNRFFKQANTHMPLPNFLIISTLFALGTGVLFYECYLISAFESDLDTVRFVLRYDIAYLIWFIASALMLVSLVYLIYLGGRSRYGPITTKKLVTGTLLAIILISFFSRDLILIAMARYSTPPEDVDLTVGLNVGNITKLDTDYFDKAIHMEVTWKEVYELGPDQSYWTDIDWQLDYAMRNNFEVYFQVHPLPPNWFIEQNEEAVMRDQWGNKFLWLDEDPRSNTSRIWDLSFNDPKVLEAKLNFTREAVQRYQNLSCIKFIGIQNEPTYPVDFNNLRIASYDNLTVEAYRTWIANQYDQDLTEFELRTGIILNDWGELEAPRKSTHKLWQSWMTFRKESLIWLVENLTGAVKQHTAKPVTVKVMAHFLARYSTVQSGLTADVVERFFQLSDVISLDLYPLTNADLQNSLEFYQKLAGGKRIIVPEFNMALGTNLPGSGAWLYYNLIVLNRYVDYVFIFTGGGHYLYSINNYDHTPVHLGLKLFRLHREDGNVFSLYDELIWENILSIPNYYEVYVLSCAVYNIPVIPWPVLLMVMLPLPIADENKLKRAAKIKYITIIILLIVFSIAVNL